MNRSDRILSIYIRLIKGQHLNKQALSNEMQVDKRTIQRDIDDIRSHFYDSEEYGGQRLEITYSHLDNSYFLYGDETKQSNHLFKILLLLIRATTPILNKEIHQFLETLIFTQYKKDNKDLLSILNSFSINENSLPMENIQHVIQAIEQSHSLYHHEHETEVDPLSLSYKTDAFTVEVSQGKEIYEYTLNDNTFTTTDTPARNKVEAFTFEIENSLWERLKNTIPLISLEAASEKSVIVTLKMDTNDALILSYTQAPFIRLIEPSPVKDMMTDKLMAMVEMYMNQTINTKEHT